jgi:hypothetical protein
MNALKITNFLKIHDRQFPVVRELPLEECDSLRQRLCRTFHLDEKLDGLETLREMEDMSANVAVNPCAATFSLVSLLNQYRIPTSDLVFVNWNRFTQIDELQLSELSTYFTDIWYPSADDIEIFDYSCRWFVIIRHWCAMMIGLVDQN